MLDSQNPLVSLIIPVKNEGYNIQNTIRSILDAKTSYSFEIIVIDDASSDGCCDFLTSYTGSTQLKLIRTKGLGIANARNMGAKNSLGKYLIFCDAHVFVGDFWIEWLLKPIIDGVADGTAPAIADTKTPDFFGYGQTLNEQLRIVWHLDKTDLFQTAVLPGGCCAFPRNVFMDIGGFDSGFRQWGFDDIEISMKMWLFGYTCYVQPLVKILHVFRQSTPYQVDYSNVYFNMLRMAYSHFNEERINKCKNLIERSSLPQIEADVLVSGVLQQRNLYLSRRKYDDDWYMKKFSIPF